MDYLEELGYLALGSRLKRLSERLGQHVADVYKAAAVDFEPRWFPVFRLIADRGTIAITDIALAVGITHPAVNQIAQELLNAGLFEAGGDPSDKRRRLLSLTDEGRKRHEQLKPLWRQLHASLSDLTAECGIDLANAAQSMEKALDRSSLSDRIQKSGPDNPQESLQVKDLSPELASNFSRLNRAWIEKYFALEQSDLEQLARPEKIVSEGGAVLFACLGDKVVGTCALKRKNSTTFELVKMAVDEAYRGMGIGRLLLAECIKRAKKLKAQAIILETNRKLKEAVRMYESVGFHSTPTKEHQSPYARVDLVMKMDLAAVTKSKSS